MAALNDPATSVVFVEPQPTRRAPTSDLFRTLGYSRVKSMPSIRDVLDLLAVEAQPPDWILAPLCDDEPTNALHLLATIVRVPALRGVRMSLFLEDGDVPWLPHAFELGLLSAHRRTPHIQGLGEEVAALLELGRSLAWDDCLIAAEQLRRQLRRSSRHVDLLHLEQALLALRPESRSLAVRLAEALHLSGRDDAALAVLGRASGLDEAAAAAAKQLRDRLADRTSASAMAAFAQEWELSRAVVVDPDAAMASFVKSVLEKMGIARVEVFARGDEAWQGMLQAGEPDLVVQEWRMPGVSGSALLQRLRAHGFEKVPVFIHSALVTAGDRFLLREMGASDVIPKPLGQQQLAQALMAAIKEEKRPQAVTALERNARKALRAGDAAAAKQLILQLGGSSAAPAGVVTTLEAELAFLGGDLKAANRLAVEALQVRGEDIVLFNLLGKIYMRLRLFEQATRFFERADALSPGNVERLCALAESHAEAGVDAAARLAQAKRLDPTNVTLIGTEAKISLAGDGAVESIKAMLSKLPDPEGVVAFLNNRAVALSAEARFDEAIELYKKALASLPKSLDVLAPTVRYNLALALIRRGDLDGARWQLAEVAKGKSSPVTAKARSLLERANRAYQAQEPLQLRRGGGGSEPELDVEEALADSAALPVAVGAAPGSMRCHLVFHADGPLDPRFAELTANSAELARRIAARRATLAGETVMPAPAEPKGKLRAPARTGPAKPKRRS